MSAVRLGRTAVLLSHHVDALELTCSVEQLPGLLLRDRTDPLERVLADVQGLAREQQPQCAVESDWLWRDDEVVIVQPDGRRKGNRYCIECSDWIGFVAAIGAVVPRITIQCRSEYLLRVGALAAFDEVTGWVDDNLLPLIEGRPEEDVARWRIARLDLAADVTGVSFRPSRLRHFTSRANVRRAYEDEPEETEEGA